MKDPNHKPGLPVRDSAFERAMEMDTVAKSHWSWRPRRKRALRASIKAKLAMETL